MRTAGAIILGKTNLPVSPAAAPMQQQAPLAHLQRVQPQLRPGGSQQPGHGRRRQREFCHARPAWKKPVLDSNPAGANG